MAIISALHEIKHNENTSAACLLKIQYTVNKNEAWMNVGFSFCVLSSKKLPRNLEASVSWNCYLWMKHSAQRILCMGNRKENTRLIISRNAVFHANTFNRISCTLWFLTYFTIIFGGNKQIWIVYRGIYCSTFRKIPHDSTLFLCGSLCAFVFLCGWKVLNFKRTSKKIFFRTNCEYVTAKYTNF